MEFAAVVTADARDLFVAKHDPTAACVRFWEMSVMLTEQLARSQVYPVGQPVVQYPGHVAVTPLTCMF